MSIIRYNNRLLSPGMFNLLGDIFEGETNASNNSTQKDTIPAINVSEVKEAFQLEMAVPGMDKDEINVAFEEGVLTISSEKKEEKNDEKDNYTRREFNYTSFNRSFNIPEDVDTTKIKAKHENGVLKIDFPKKEVKPSLKQMIKVA